MGYFSELDIDLRQGKNYLEQLEAVARDRELTEREICESQTDIWEYYGQPAPLTDEEVYAVLTDDISSPALETALVKLTHKSNTSPSVYAKRNNR